MLEWDQIQGFSSACFIQGFCIKFIDLTLGIFIDTAIIQQICHYQTYNVPLLQFIKYHSYQRYQYRLLSPAKKSRITNNSEQYLTLQKTAGVCMILTLFVVCACVRVCLCATMNVSMCVCVCIKCGNEGIYLCTLLNYNCITVKKKNPKQNTETDIHIKRTAWVNSMVFIWPIFCTL